MQKDAFYFPHDYNARTDEKIIPLIKALGWQAYGLYWAITEKMHEAGGELILDYESIAFDLRTEPEMIEKIVNNFNLFRLRGKKFYSDRVKKNLANRIIKSEKARLSARKRWGYDSLNNDANALPTLSEGNARKERKGKEIKGKDIVVRKVFKKPTVEEIKTYISEIKSSIDPQYFFDKNEGNGWVWGRNQTPIKDWKAVVRTWEKNQNERANTNKQNFGTSSERDRRKTDLDAIGEEVNLSQM